MASREVLTLKDLLHRRRGGKHGATMCTLQVQEQLGLRHGERRAQEQKQQEQEQ